MSKEEKKTKQYIFGAVCLLGIAGVGYYVYKNQQQQNDSILEDEDQNKPLIEEEYEKNFDIDKTLIDENETKAMDDNELNQNENQNDNDFKQPMDEDLKKKDMEKDQEMDAQKLEQSEVEKESEKKEKEKEKEEQQESEQDIKLKKDIEKYKKLKTDYQKLNVYQYKNGKIIVKVIKATNVDNKDGKGGISDPFVLLQLPNTKSHKTKVIDNNANPVWNETFELPVHDTIRDTLICTLYDKDQFTKNDKIGTVKIKVLDLCKNNGHIQKDFDVDGSQIGAKLLLDVVYTEH